MPRFVRFILFVALLGGAATAAHAQYPFGKNKVIYKGRDWRVLQTEHVDIYHYAPDSTLIMYLAPMVEETFQEYSATFRLEFSHRLPFVFYATHYDFQQTNILPSLISEYTGGFTDLMKGRIAVPANYISIVEQTRRATANGAKLDWNAYRRLGEAYEALRKPAVDERLRALGSEPWGTNPEQFRRAVIAELELWKKVGTEANVKLD